MSFDPAALQDIQPPDIAGGVARGFQLKDMVDTQQLNKLRLNSEKQTLADNEKAKGILSSADLSSNRGIAEASEKLTRAGVPGKAMELRKYGQQAESGELDNRQKQVELLHAQATEIDGLLSPVLSQAMQVSAKDPATAQAYVKAQLPLIKMQIRDSTVLDENIKKNAMQKIDQEMASPDPFSALKGALASNKQIMEQLKSAREERKVDVADRSEQEREKHDRTMEGLALRKTTDSEKKATGGASEEQIGKRRQLLGAMGDLGVPLPVGLRNKETQNAALDGIIARHPDMSFDDIAKGIKNGQISMGVSKTEGNVLARREAAILPVEKSITRPGGFLDQAQKAVDAVDFSKLKAAGQFEQWSKDQNSDPSLARYKAAVAELRAEYSIVLSKGGQVTDAARHESEKVIPDLITKEQFKAIKQVVLQGIESSKGGIEESIGGVTGKDATTADPKSNDPLGIR